MKSGLFLLLLLIATGGCSTQPQPQSDSSAENPVPENPADVSPLLIGELIPDITLQNHLNESVNLRETGSDPTLYVFYRGGWCPFCSTELAGISAIEDSLYALGFEIVAISPDRPGFLQQSMGDIQMNYTLLSDSAMTASKAFGIAFRLDDDTYERYKSNGMDLEERSGLDHHLLPVPAVFLANSSGVIAFQYVNPDYRQRIDKDVLMEAAKSVVESNRE